MSFRDIDQNKWASPRPRESTQRLVVFFGAFLGLNFYCTFRNLERPVHLLNWVFRNFRRYSFDFLYLKKNLPFYLHPSFFSYLFFSFFFLFFIIFFLILIFTLLSLYTEFSENKVMDQRSLCPNFLKTKLWTKDLFTLIFWNQNYEFQLGLWINYKISKCHE